MEYIWSQVPKEIKDGVEYITYVKSDLPYLYNSGMVDTNRFSYDQWEKAFDDCLGDDGRYWVDHRKMIFLGFFRYSKTVNEPFDPLKMRTGKYSTDRLKKVLERSIIPSTSLPADFMKKTFDQMFKKHESFGQIFKKNIEEAKEKGEEFDESQVTPINFKGDYVIIERQHLLNMRNLLDNYPSPRRKMEMGVAQLRSEKLQEMAGMVEQPQKSTFESGKDFRETTKESLKDMLVKASEDATGGRKPTEPPVNIKDMKKPKRPTKF